ncbi:hypothetical protein ACQ4PT_066715 [Festuca glaucescens]
MKDKRAQQFMWSLGYTNSLGVSSEGQSGGLVLYWMQPYAVSLRGSNSHCVDVIVTGESGVEWRVSFIYGEPRREKRQEFWDFMHSLSTQWSGPWICCGDFNEVLCQEEHFGSSGHSDTQIRLFKECLEDCSLSDLGFSGPMFTWTNKQEADCNVRVRLDRVVANGEFMHLYDDFYVENVITTTSDHYALFIDMKKHSNLNVNQPVKMGFKYEAAWLRSPDYRPRLERTWESNSVGSVSLQSTWTKLQRVSNSLAQWSKDTFGAVRKEI